MDDIEAEFAEKTREISEECEVPEISAERAVALISGDAPVVVFDVRSRTEVEVSMLPGAIHVGKGSKFTLAEVVDDALAKHADSTWMMYCGTGYNSARAISGLPKQLRQRTFNIVGGAIGYANAGGTLVLQTTGEPTDRVHAYEDWARFVKAPVKPVV